MTTEPTPDDRDDRIAKLESELREAGASISKLESELNAVTDALYSTLDLCEEIDIHMQAHHNFVLSILREALGLTEPASVYSMAKEIHCLKRMEEYR